MSDDFFIRLERQLTAAELRELNRGPVLRRFVGARRSVSPRRPLSVPLAAAAALGVVVVALVAVLVTVWREPDVERSATPPGNRTPCSAAWLTVRKTSAACSSDLAGMHPRCRQVPPTLSFSIRATRLPNSAARSAQA